MMKRLKSLSDPQVIISTIDDATSNLCQHRRLWLTHKAAGQNATRSFISGTLECLDKHTLLLLPHWVSVCVFV